MRRAYKLFRKPGSLISLLLVLTLASGALSCTLCATRTIVHAEEGDGISANLPSQAGTPTPGTPVPALPEGETQAPQESLPLPTEEGEAANPDPTAAQTPRAPAETPAPSPSPEPEKELAPDDQIATVCTWPAETPAPSPAPSPEPEKELTPDDQIATVCTWPVETPAPSPAPSPEPEKELTPDDQIATVCTWPVEPLRLRPGEQVRLPVGIAYRRGELVWESARNAQYGQPVTATEAEPAFGWAAPPEHIAWLEVALPDAITQETPLILPAETGGKRLVEQGGNVGYVFLEGVAVAPDASPGAYALPLRIIWHETDTARTFEAAVRLPFVVEEGEEDTQQPQEPMQPLSLPISVLPMLTDDGGIIVFTYAELRKAVEDAYSLIYLGYHDGTQAEYAGQAINNGRIVGDGITGCRVPATISSLTVVGRDPLNGKRVTYQESSAVGEAYSFYPAGANQTIRLKDMVISGYNYYGSMSGYGQANTTLIFDQVEYNGPQPFHSRGENSKIILRDTSVTIIAQGCPAQEVAEVPNVELQGVVEINHANTNAVFWLTGGSCSVTVAAGANVRVATASYFIYCDGTNNVNVNILGSLKLEMANNVNSAFFIDAGKRANLNIPVGGALDFTHIRTSGTMTYGSLCTNNATVAGSLRITRNAGVGNYGALEVADGCTLRLDHPTEFVLSNAQGTTIKSVSGTASLVADIGAVNRYTSTGGFAAHVWNRPDLSALSIRMGLATLPANHTVTGLAGLANGAPDRLTATLPNDGATIDMSADRKLTMGPVRAASLNPVYCGDTVVTGSVSLGAQVRVIEMGCTNGVFGPKLQDSGVLTSTAGTFSTGQSAMTLPIQAGKSRVYLWVDDGRMEYTTYVEPTEWVGGPSIQYLPEELLFQTVPLAGYDQLIPRADADWHVTVHDPRNAQEGYSLRVSIEAPLTSAGAEQLPSALVFKQGSTIIPLSSQQLTIASKQGVDGQQSYTYRWAADEGLLVLLPAYTGVAGEVYQTDILWTLVAE